VAGYSSVFSPLFRVKIRIARGVKYMELLACYVIPSIIIVITNVFDGDYGSTRYEKITAIFGWITIISLLLLLLKVCFSIYILNLISLTLIIEVLYFCLFTCLVRDYSRLIRKVKEFF